MVKVIPVQQIGTDERGTTHVFETDRTGQFIVSYRKAGSSSGRHYHKGVSPRKNPEQIIIMQGEATVNWFNVRGDEKGTLKVRFVRAPSWGSWLYSSSNAK